MISDWSAGLKDQDELSQYPSAASPLTALGIDPDEARANPDLLASLMSPSSGGDSNRPRPPLASAVNMPSDDDNAQPPKPAPSVVAAGKTGGAGDTSAPTTPATPAQTPQDELLGYGKEGLGLLNKNFQSATDETGKMSTDTPADVARLTAQQEKLETKTPLRDAQGNILPQYKPSTGSKIWRGVRGGLVGLLTGGIPGAAVGALEPQDIRGGTAYGAPNKTYDRAEDTRQQQLASTGDELSTAMKNWKDVNDARKEKASQYRANAALGKDVTTGATGLINAENKPESEANKTAAKLELDQKTFDLRRQQLTTDPSLSKLSPLNKAYYMAEGKVYQPRESNEADLLASNIAKATVTFKNSHGGKNPATLEEFNSVISAAKGDLGKGKGSVTPQQNRAVADKKNAAIEKALGEYAKDPGQKDTLAELQRQLQAAQNAYEEDVSNLGGDAGPHQVVAVDENGQAKWTPAVAPAPAAPVPTPATPAPVAPAPAAQAAPAKPQPAPDGTRRQSPDGTIEVKTNGKWKAETK